MQRQQHVQIAARKTQDAVHTGEDVLILRVAGIRLIQAPVVHAAGGLLRKQPARAVRVGVRGGGDGVVIFRDELRHFGELLGACELMAAVGDIVTLVQLRLQRQPEHRAGVERRRRNAAVRLFLGTACKHRNEQDCREQKRDHFFHSFSSNLISPGTRPERRRSSDMYI